MPAMAAASGALIGAASAGAAASRDRPTAPITPQSFLEKDINSPFLQCGFAGFACTNAHRLLDIENEDLAIADRARIRGRLNGPDHARRAVVAADHIDRKSVG